jgi:hypothetical protein
MLREFLHEAFEAVTNVERSFLHTLWTLVRHPGELTAAYMRGERVRYLKPLQLFLLVNVLFFFVAGPGVNVYTTSYGSHLYGSPYRVTAQRIATERRTAAGLTEPQYRAAFDQQAPVLARTLLLAMAPAFAIAVAVISFRRRRPAIQHLVFGIQFLTIVLLLTIVITYLLLGLVLALRPIGQISDYAVEQMAALIMVASVVAYLVPAYRRAYGDGNVAAVIKAAISAAALVAILVGYRFLLFFVTVFTL